MKMEELIGRLGESEDTGRRILSKTMKRKYDELKNGEDVERRNESFESLNGCINAMMGLGEITESEENSLWNEMFHCLYGEEKV